jgi:hypothetical protein
MTSVEPRLSSLLDKCLNDVGLSGAFHINLMSMQMKNKKDETCAKEQAAIKYECMEQNICEMNDK